jgi:hypothetical protein
VEWPRYAQNRKFGKPSNLKVFRSIHPKEINRIELFNKNNGFNLTIKNSGSIDFSKTYPKTPAIIKFKT